MLDRLKLAIQLDQLAPSIFADYSPQYFKAYEAWQQLVNDTTFSYKVRATKAAWPLPTWHGRIDATFSISSRPSSYRVLGVDGSQVYPDRHYGFSCFLINVGSVLLSYGEHAGVKLKSIPQVIAERDYEFQATDQVNALRQEFELAAGIQEYPDEQNLLIALDGSLIFWHLEARDTALREYFLPRYLVLLEAYKEQKRLIFSYVSQPRSRELANVVRLYLHDGDVHKATQDDPIERVTDVAILRTFLQPGKRTTVFANRSAISSHYSPDQQPHFFYLNNGIEIGRVEIPAWVAASDERISYIASCILDQCAKGQGYPIALAEAHEQAVIKGADREFFYLMLQKRSAEFTSKTMQHMSQKAMRKRSMAV